MQLKIKKLHQNAIVPAYQTAGAACFDLHAINGGIVGGKSANVFDTGLAFEVPEGYALMIYSRSGHGFKNNIRLVNCVGVVDSDYRGQVRVKLINDSSSGYIVMDGERIAQAMLIKVEHCSLTVVEELTETERGENGYGSTGK